MTVYIEYVLVDNFLIDYFLLKTTFIITGKTVKTLNLIISSLSGAVMAILFPLLPDVFAVTAAVKICCGCIVAFSAAHYKSFKDFYINAVIFFALTFALGGTMIGVFGILGLNYRTETAVALMAAPAYLFICFLKSVVRCIYRRKGQQAHCVRAEITNNGKTLSVNGFVDTGNGVYDGDSPVVFCDKKTALKIMGGGLPKLKKLALFTVSGKSYAAAFKVERIKIFISGRTNIFNNVTVAAVKNVGTGYDVILHPALTEVQNERDCAS